MIVFHLKGLGGAGRHAEKELSEQLMVMLVVVVHRDYLPAASWWMSRDAPCGEPMFRQYPNYGTNSQKYPLS